ncbi:PIN domain-containing protein [Breznakiellaceae bacterium SP9]
MITYALDSNIVSYFLRKDVNVSKKIRDTPAKGNQIVIPNVVYYEVLRGLLAKFSPKKTATFNQLCKIYKVGSMDKETGEIAAYIYAELPKRGRLVEDADLLIAAYCIQNDYTLVTNNSKHFENIDTLQFVNWIE